MIETIAPLLAAAVLIAVSAGLGILPMRKTIQMSEARHELKHGSASFLRAMSGWFFILVWIATTWFVATVLGDWWITSDWNGAVSRGIRRLEVLLHVLAAFSSD